MRSVNDLKQLALTGVLSVPLLGFLAVKKIQPKGYLPNSGARLLYCIWSCFFSLRDVMLFANVHKIFIYLVASTQFTVAHYECRIYEELWCASKSTDFKLCSEEKIWSIAGESKMNKHDKLGQ